MLLFCVGLFSVNGVVGSVLVKVVSVPISGGVSFFINARLTPGKAIIVDVDGRLAALLFMSVNMTVDGPIRRSLCCSVSVKNFHKLLTLRPICLWLIPIAGALLQSVEIISL